MAGASGDGDGERWAAAAARRRSASGGAGRQPGRQAGSKLRCAHAESEPRAANEGTQTSTQPGKVGGGGWINRLGQGKGHLGKANDGTMAEEEAWSERPSLELLGLQEESRRGPSRHQATWSVAPERLAPTATARGTSSFVAGAA